MLKLNRYLTLLVSLLSICFIAPVALAQQANLFDQIVFFGDSLSDNGNLYRADFKLVPRDPPYFDGRFSNGHVWSENTADYFKNLYSMTSTNYAYGGETALWHNPADGYLPYNLTMSRESYLLHSVFQDRTHSLFIVWIGANDYMPAIDPDIEKLTSDVVASIQATVESLISHGAYNVIVINLPDIAKTPFAKNSGKEATLNALVNAHNEKLRLMVENLQNGFKEVHVEYYDIHSLFDDLITNTDYYNQKYHLHITNTTEACWNGGYRLQRLNNAELTQEIANDMRKQTLLSATNKQLTPELLASSIANSPDLKVTYQTQRAYQLNELPCTAPDSYIFWDRIHPNANIHAILADGMNQFIKERFLS